MMKLRRFTLTVSAMAIVTFLALGALAAGPTAKSGTKTDKARLLAPVNMAILIQDDLVSRVSNEIETTRDFIRSLPNGSRVMVGYITAGSLQLRQPFTTDLETAAKSLRIPIASTSASAFNPYVEVIEALRKFDSEAKGQNQNVLLLISDGLDDSRGFDASVLQSLDLQRAISEAKRRDVPIYSFYAPSVGLTGRSRLAASYGQSSLSRVSNETGGKAFFQGFSFVSFNSHFERLIDALNNYEKP